MTATPQHYQSDDAAGSFYDVLEVPLTADFDTIKSSYQQKARKLHPDKRRDGKTKDGDAEFLLLQKAWECLRDPTSRRDYDAELSKRQSSKSKSQEVDVEEWEMVEEEDTGELSRVYTCRCGEEIWLPEGTFQRTRRKQSDDDNQSTNITSTESNVVYATCSGCSLVYHVVL